MIRTKLLAGVCKAVCSIASERARVNIRCSKLPAPNTCWPPASLSFCQLVPVPIAVSALPAVPCERTSKLAAFDDAEDWDPFEIDEPFEMEPFDGPF